MPRSRAPAPPIYTFRVTLSRGPASVESDVWRDVEVAANQTLENLGHAIPAAFGFDEDHMWSFFLSGKPWDSSTEYAWHGPLDIGESGGRPAGRLHIQDAPLRGKKGAKGWLFVFDYGDEWHFDVAFQGARDQLDPKARYPRIVESHGEAPPQYAYDADGWDDDDEDDEVFGDEELTEEETAELAELEELALTDPGLIEAAIGQLEQILKDKKFDSPEELTAYVDSGEWLSESFGREPSAPLDQAQDMVYEAWEAPSKKGRVRLAKQALATSPDCADAYVILAMDAARSPEEEIELYRQGVAAGERALAPEAFKEYAGSFWGILETRPYMRARAGLAGALWEAGRHDEAVEHWEEMLRLNPGDNQGIRYILLSFLLEMGDQPRVRKLLKQYPDDIAAQWVYGAALHAFVREGDNRKSQRLLAEAREMNPHVPAYLTGKKRLPKEMPAFTGMGDVAEAQWCVSDQMAAWQRTPGALEWLARHS